MNNSYLKTHEATVSKVTKLMFNDSEIITYENDNSVYRIVNIKTYGPYGPLGKSEHTLRDGVNEIIAEISYNKDTKIVKDELLHILHNLNARDTVFKFNVFNNKQDKHTTYMLDYKHDNVLSNKLVRGVVKGLLKIMKKQGNRMENLITVTRVENSRDINSVVFKDAYGKIIYLDRKDVGNDVVKEKIAVGEDLTVAITTSNDSYDFSLATIDGMLLDDYISNIPNITLEVIESVYERNNDSGRDVRLLLNIVNNNNNVTNTEIRLPNLISIYDTIRNTESMYRAILSLQALYNTKFENNSDNNNGLDSSTISDLRAKCVSNTHVEHTSYTTEQPFEGTPPTESDEPLVVSEVSDNDNTVLELENVIKSLTSMGLNSEADAVRVKLKDHQDKLYNKRVLNMMSVGSLYIVKLVDGSYVVVTMTSDNEIVIAGGALGSRKVAIDKIHELYESKTIYVK